MRLGPSLYPLFALGASIAVAACALQPAARPTPVAAASRDAPSPAVKAALDEAEQVLAEVKRAGNEWRLIDRATGPDSEPLTYLLEKARELGTRGNGEEAMRIANRVKEMATLGLKQASDGTHAVPVYPR